MQPASRPAAGTALEVLGLVLCALLVLPFLLSGDRAPLEADYGNIFLPSLFQMRAALFDGSLLTWDAERFGGTPYWAVPNTAPAYPPLLLALLLRGPIGATNLTLLAHLVAGALGMRALSRSLGAGRIAAFAAATLFLHLPLARHFAFNQPWATMAMAYLPWALLQVVRQAGGADWRAAGIAAGLLCSGMTWCGGYTVFLPCLAAVGLLALCLALRRKGLARALLRAGGMLVLLLVVLLATSAGRLLPSAAWTELTSRAAGLPLADTVEDSMSAGDIWSWALKPGFLAFALALLALGAGLAGRRRGAVAIGLAILGLMLLCTGLPQRAFLYDYVPGFDRIRLPRHFWAPVEVLCALLFAAGLDVVLGLARRRGLTAAAGAALGALAIGWMGFESLRFGWIEPPPRIDSLRARLAANPLHQDLARRAAEEPRFRVHDARDTRPKLKKTANLLRSALGLESIEGVLGNISIPAYDLELIAPSRAQGPRLWGLLNCLYVTSEAPLSEPELALAGTFEEDPLEIRPGTDGPYLYRNRAAQPRASLAPRAALLLDAPREERTRVLASRAWSPRREVLVTARSDALADDVLRRFDVVLDGAPAREDDALERRLRDLGLSAARLPPPGRGGDLQALLGDAPGRMQPLPDPERGWNRAHVTLPGDAGPTWLVLAETYAIYPGWRARVDGVETPLLVANGAATALPLPAGAREVELAFTPPGLRTGLIVSAAGLALSLAALYALRRSRLKRAPPRSAAP